MIPALLITLREVIEASLIVATILGILTKLQQKEKVRDVWIAAAGALIASFVLVVGGSYVGVNVHRIFEGPWFEGPMYILSAFFVTWAVFTLHTHFAQKKMQLLSRVREKVSGGGILAFTFLAVFREGIEISVFLSTLYLTAAPVTIISGFAGGLMLGIIISILFFRATVRIPIYWAFRMTSFLLIIFAGGLLAQGVGIVLEVSSFRAIANSVHTFPALAAITYIYVMHRYVFLRSR